MVLHETAAVVCSTDSAGFFTVVVSYCKYLAKIYSLRISD